MINKYLLTALLMVIGTFPARHGDPQKLLEVSTQGQSYLGNKNSDTVDGRNPAPPGMYKNLESNRINYLSTGTGFFPSTVVFNCCSFQLMIIISIIQVDELGAIWELQLANF